MEKANLELWNKTWNKLSGNIVITDMDKLIFKELIRYIKVRDKEIIELGCGRGILSFLMANNGAKTVNLVDFSEEALNIARKLFVDLNNVEFIKSDIFHFDELKKYDIVFSSGVAEHFADKLREEIIYRHLRMTKDIAIIVVPARPHFNTIRHRKRRVIALYGWQYSFSKEEINKIIRKYGDYDIIHNQRFYPLYGVNLFELLSIDGKSIFFRLWNFALHLIDAILYRIRFYKFFNMILSMFSNKLGGLLIVILKRSANMA